MSNMKPIHLYSHAGGPNPFKVVIILEELGIPYESEYIDFSALKQESYTNVNPNGRLPSIHDPNTDITIWESGAIIEYLEETYDKSNTLNYTSSPEKWLQSSWKHFQMSGQGPYFGQFAWFSFFHPEKGITSAIDRYANEIKRVLGVINSHLEKTGKPYLVGDKISYVDLMFIPWNNGMINGGLGKEFAEKEFPEKYPKCKEWHDKLMQREGVKKAVAVVDEAKKAAGK